VSERLRTDRPPGLLVYDLLRRREERNDLLFLLGIFVGILLARASIIILLIVNKSEKYPDNRLELADFLPEELQLLSLVLIDCKS